MKDFLGQELEVGDKVILIRPGYREFTKGVIVRFTKCLVILTYKHYCGDFVYEIKQTPDQLVKIHENH